MKDLLLIIIWVVVVAIVLMFIPWLTEHLWNWLMPEIFGLKKITILQALGLVLLSNLLFNIKTTK